MFFAVQEPGIRSGLGPVFPSLLAASTWKAGNEAACAARCELARTAKAKLRPIQAGVVAVTAPPTGSPEQCWWPGPERRSRLPAGRSSVASLVGSVSCSRWGRPAQGGSFWPG